LSLKNKKEDMKGEKENVEGSENDKERGWSQTT